MEGMLVDPRKKFKSDWPGWDAFLGTGRARPNKLRSPEEWVTIAEQIASEHGGVLPRAAWLIKQCCGLYSAMSRHPGLFSHIHQDRPNKKPEQWALAAGAIAKSNGGLLPCGKWLCENGYGGILGAKRKHPELFLHIEQENLRSDFRTPEGWVSVAEILADENNGILPCIGRLKNLHSGLARAIRKRPELFAHIKLERRSPGGRPINQESV